MSVFSFYDYISCTPHLNIQVNMCTEATHIWVCHTHTHRHTHTIKRKNHRKSRIFLKKGMKFPPRYSVTP